MKSELGTLADLGQWPGIKIGYHSVICHAYENVMNACAIANATLRFQSLARARNVSMTPSVSSTS
jgi:hypothetical protein